MPAWSRPIFCLNLPGRRSLQTPTTNYKSARLHSRSSTKYSTRRFLRKRMACWGSHSEALTSQEYQEAANCWRPRYLACWKYLGQFQNYAILCNDAIWMWFFDPRLCQVEDSDSTKSPKFLHGRSSCDLYDPTYFGMSPRSPSGSKREEKGWWRSLLVTFGDKRRLPPEHWQRTTSRPPQMTYLSSFIACPAHQAASTRLV